MRHALRRYVGHQVIIQVGEDSLSGIVRRVSRDSLTIDSASLATGRTPVPMDGAVVVPVSRLRWVQAI